MAIDPKTNMLNGESNANGHKEQDVEKSDVVTEGKLTNGTSDVANRDADPEKELNGKLEEEKEKPESESKDEKKEAESKTKSKPVVRYDE